MTEPHQQSSPDNVGSQSGEESPRAKETAADPLRDPSAAGADLYNSGNKTGNPVRSGTPGVGDHKEGVYATEKKTPVTKDD